MFLYRFYDADDTLLYVGITSTPERRFGSHKSSSRWWPQVRRHTLEQCSSETAARRIERQAIWAERPLHNKVGARVEKVDRDMPLIQRVIGSNIAHALGERGMSQGELARRLDVSASTITHYLRGEINMGVTTLKEIADILGKDPGDLLDDEPVTA